MIQVIDKKITTTDTGIHFKKLKSMKLSFADYNTFLEDLAKTKKVELDEIKSKMANCGAPGIHNATVNTNLFRFSKFQESTDTYPIPARKGSRNCGAADRYIEIHRIAQAAV